MTHPRKSAMPRTHSTSQRKGATLNYKMEAMMKDFLARFAEASYNVALKLGFRGSFITFLSDLQEALEEVLRKDKRNAKSEKVSVH